MLKMCLHMCGQPYTQTRSLFLCVCVCVCVYANAHTVGTLPVGTQNYLSLLDTCSTWMWTMLGTKFVCLPVMSELFALVLQKCYLIFKQPNKYDWFMLIVIAWRYNM